MVDAQTYKLPERLESIVNSATEARYLREGAQEGVNLQLKRSASRFYSQKGIRDIAILVDPKTFLGDNDHQFELRLIEGENNIYDALARLLEDGDDFGVAKQFYISKLNEDNKAKYAAMLLEKGVVPDAPADNDNEAQKNAHKKLLNVAGVLQYANALELAVRKGDLRTARKLLKNKAPGILANYVLGDYIVRNMTEAELGVYEHIAKANRIFAENTIKQNKLYELMDKGIAKHPLGKAYSLVAMHELYSAQSAESDVDVTGE